MKNNFTRDELKKIRTIKNEISLLAEELHKASTKVTCDTVTGSRDCFPYDKRTITVRGVDVRAVQKLQPELERKLKKLQDELAELEEWLDMEPDPEMRTILRLYFRNGLTQGQIGDKLGYDRSVISRKIKCFFNNLQA